MDFLLVFQVVIGLAALCIIAYRLRYFYNFRHSYGRRIPFKVVHSRLEIEGSSSRDRKKYMQNSNHLMAAFGIAVLLILVLFLVPFFG